MTYVTPIWRTLYGFYGWLVFILCAALALLRVTVLGAECAAAAPTGRSQHTKAIFMCSAAFQPTFEALKICPKATAVVVANHASYVDGFLLKGYLPYRFSFVIKGEMRKIPVAHFLLRRSGSKFVERFMIQSGSSARTRAKLSKRRRSGDSLAFFPEGTFTEGTRHRALSRWRFRVRHPRRAYAVVPVAIRGPANMLPAGRFLPMAGATPISWYYHRFMPERSRHSIITNYSQRPPDSTYWP